MKPRNDAMKRVLLPLAACAFAALAAAGCKPPVEQSEFNNSGLSVAVASDPSAVPEAPANPPPRIQVPEQASAPEQAVGGATPGTPNG
jgi:hypothetical protein